MENDRTIISLDFEGTDFKSLSDFITIQSAKMQDIEIGSAWVERRKGASNTAQDELENLLDTLDSSDFSQAEFPNHCFKISALLFSCGSPHSEWQHWNSVGVAAALLLKHYKTAIRYALLSHEYSVLEKLPFEVVAHSNDAQVGLLLLLFKGNLEDSSLYFLFFKDFWFELCSGISRAAWRNDRRYLKEYVLIYINWWMKKMPDWNIHEPNQYPDFEPILCAWIILLLEMGFLKISDISDFQEFLGPVIAPKIDSKISLHFEILTQL
jgi:hypothetical protein